MKQMEKIQESVRHLKQNSWTDKQIVGAIQALSMDKPENLKKIFRSLVYFFSILPTNETVADNFDLVDVSSAFTNKEFKSLMFFLNEFQAEL